MSCSVLEYFLSSLLSICKCILLCNILHIIFCVNLSVGSVYWCDWNNEIMIITIFVLAWPLLGCSSSLSLRGSQHLLGPIRDVFWCEGGESSSTSIANSAQPPRHWRTARAQTNAPRDHTDWLSVNEINKEPVTFQENGQRSSTSTETWKLVGRAPLSPASAMVVCVAGRLSADCVWQLEDDSWGS